MKSILLTLAILLSLVSNAAAQKRTYECARAGIKLNFKVTDGEILDKVSGKAVFKVGDYTLDMKGTYNPVLDVFLAFVKSTPTAKKKVVTGNWDEENDTFFLSIKVAKNKSAEFVCPRKKTKADLLTGVWVINDTSFLSVELKEGFDGAITGKGLGSFSAYTLSGVRTNDGEVTLQLNSPDGLDDTSYTLQLCTSGASMVGKSDSTVSPATTLCRKNRSINQECIADESCPAIP